MSEFTPGPSYDPEPFTPGPAPQKDSKNTILIIVIVVAVLLLCCCCLTIIGVAAIYGEDIMRALSQALPLLLAS
ncbi:MAG: hypothetical protein JW900_01695 [Anaerolineae bacterium]|nr:hypothetical protein [Anaerolineae bacterium]